MNIILFQFAFFCLILCIKITKTEIKLEQIILTLKNNNDKTAKLLKLNAKNETENVIKDNKNKIKKIMI